MPCPSYLGRIPSNGGYSPRADTRIDALIPVKQVPVYVGRIPERVLRHDCIVEVVVRFA